ncbi:MAG: hypothetical protein DI565_11280 [Ancylobacter novellus]|uniref:Uncharacterized protein n=1 Tax=Ancylobacter novellus TaxID=921 RepID=A0A2W5MNC2_ANCNO|nr:MAG: hypothetical protein DI565_11280 [Ancylobacter novellus]
MKDDAGYFGHKVDPRRGDVVYLSLERCVRLGGELDRLISFDLRTEAEIDRAVEDLRRQLDCAAKGAKAALKKRSGKRKGG